MTFVRHVLCRYTKGNGAPMGARLSNSFQTMSLEKNLESLRKHDEEVTEATN